VASSLGNLRARSVLPWEETVAGTSRWLGGRAEVEAKAPAQRISEGMKGGCSRLTCCLAEAAMSLCPESSWLVPRHLQVPMDMSHLPQGGWGPSLGCFKGKLQLSKPDGVMMWPYWAVAPENHHIWVLNADPQGQGTGTGCSATDVALPPMYSVLGRLPSPPHVPGAPSLK